MTALFRAVHRMKRLELLERQIATADLCRLPARHFPGELRQQLREPILFSHSLMIVWCKRLGSRAPRCAVVEALTG